MRGVDTQSRVFLLHVCSSVPVERLQAANVLAIGSLSLPVGFHSRLAASVDDAVPYLAEDCLTSRSASAASSVGGSRKVIQRKRLLDEQ